MLYRIPQMFLNILIIIAIPETGAGKKIRKTAIMSACCSARTSPCAFGVLLLGQVLKASEALF